MSVAYWAWYIFVYAYMYYTYYTNSHETRPYYTNRALFLPMKNNNHHNAYSFDCSTAVFLRAEMQNFNYISKLQLHFCPEEDCSRAVETVGIMMIIIFHWEK